jgi:hypothetical protein
LGDARLQANGANVRSLTIYLPNRHPFHTKRTGSINMFSVALESCQDLGTNQCEIKMFRKRLSQHTVIIDLEVEEVRNVRPRTSSFDDCELNRIDERCCSPIILQIEDRCSTPTNIPIQFSEARCCTPPTFQIKSSEVRRCIRPMSSRDCNIDVPLAPIRETLIARPTRFFNNEDETRKDRTAILKKFTSGNMSWTRTASHGLQ